MANFQSFTGRIAQIEDFIISEQEPVGCFKIMTVSDRSNNTVNFVVAPSTYFVNHVLVKVGDPVIGFYDADAPTPMIFPPRYEAYVMAIAGQRKTVTVDYFNEDLISSDGTLKLNIAPNTFVILENDQRFTADLENRYLIVQYTVTTRSIPAQTTPEQVVVMCM